MRPEEESVTGNREEQLPPIKENRPMVNGIDEEPVGQAPLEISAEEMIADLVKAKNLQPAPPSLGQRITSSLDSRRAKVTTVIQNNFGRIPQFIAKITGQIKG